jgi:FeS assembly SUF system regulator
MLRISKLTDYGVLLLTHLARDEQPVQSARDLAAASGLPLPTVSKVLKTLGRAGLLQSHRGTQGGFSLARPAKRISVAEIIAALEGPIALTDCSGTCRGVCELEAACPVRGHWRKITAVVHDALQALSLFDMAHAPPPSRSAAGRAVASGAGAPIVLAGRRKR